MSAEDLKRASRLDGRAAAVGQEQTNPEVEKLHHLPEHKALLNRVHWEPMNIQELGSIGEFIAAIATVLTLVYLAIQLRQNTRALKASTFQSISSEMGQNALPLVQTPDMAGIYAKSTTEPGELTPEERIKIQAMYLAMFRRLESVFVQTELGSIDREFVEGPELSLISIIKNQSGREWWESAKPIFYKPFVTHVENKIA